jgi:SAM-dependent methyltransferase
VLPFRTASFDTVLAVSSLEFVGALSRACREIRRVLKRGGVFIVVTPGHSPLVDAGLRILTGSKASQDFSDRRQKIIPTLLSYFTVDKRLNTPSVFGSSVSLYNAFRLTSPYCGHEIAAARPAGSNLKAFGHTA